MLVLLITSYTNFEYYVVAPDLSVTAFLLNLLISNSGREPHIFRSNKGNNPMNHPIRNQCHGSNSFHDFFLGVVWSGSFGQKRKKVGKERKILSIIIILLVYTLLLRNSDYACPGHAYYWVWCSIAKG